MKEQSAILFEPSDAIRGISDASIQYYLKDQLDSITFEILDANDKLIDTFTGSKPKYEVDPDAPWWERGGSSKPTTAKGLNTFKWDLRYPGATVFKGMIIWSARPQRGPKAPLGTYKVKMKTGEYEKSYAFNIRIDPNLKGITEADLLEQFELANNIMQKTSAANEAVIQIRKIREQVLSGKDQIPGSDYKKTIDPFLEKISTIEEELYQVKNQSGQDPLNFPIKLNNRLASLRRSVEDGDAKPTNGAYQVYKELTLELEKQLGSLKSLLNSNLLEINSLLRDNGASPIELIK
jgi:hypothetical protein